MILKIAGDADRLHLHDKKGFNFNDHVIMDYKNNCPSTGLQTRSLNTLEKKVKIKNVKKNYRPMKEKVRKCTSVQKQSHLELQFSTNVGIFWLVNQFIKIQYRCTDVHSKCSVESLLKLVAMTVMSHFVLVFRFGEGLLVSDFSNCWVMWNQTCIEYDDKSQSRSWLYTMKNDRDSTVAENVL